MGGIVDNDRRLREVLGRIGRIHQAIQEIDIEIGKRQDLIKVYAQELRALESAGTGPKRQKELRIGIDYQKRGIAFEKEKRGELISDLTSYTRERDRLQQGD